MILLHGILHVDILKAEGLRHPLGLPNGTTRLSRRKWLAKRCSCIRRVSSWFPGRLAGDIQNTMARTPRAKVYATVDLDKARVGRTRLFIASDPTNPLWDESFRIYCAHMADHVIFTLKSDNPIGATLLGRAFLPATTLLNNYLIDTFLDICDEDRRPLAGRIHVKVRYTSILGYDVGGWGRGVPNTFFKQRERCRVTLYHDAHVDGSFLPRIPLAGGEMFRPGRCWEDVFDAISRAQNFIYIAGWSVYSEISLVRERQRAEAGETTIGLMLKRKAGEGVRVLMLVWDDRSSVGELKKDGVMQTHDQDTAEYFRDSAVHCVLCPRNPDVGESYVQGLEIATMFTHHQKTLIVDCARTAARETGTRLRKGREWAAARRRIVCFLGGIDLCDGRYDTQKHSLFHTLAREHRNDFHQPNFPGAALRKGGPREPWHDVHCRVEGAAAWDVLSNFEQRWRKQGADDKLLLQLQGGSRGGLVVSLEEEEAAEASSNINTWNVQVEYGSTSSIINTTCVFGVCCSLWSDMLCPQIQSIGDNETTDLRLGYDDSACNGKDCGSSDAVSEEIEIHVIGVWFDFNSSNSNMLSKFVVACGLMCFVGRFRGLAVDQWQGNKYFVGNFKALLLGRRNFGYREIVENFRKGAWVESGKGEVKYMVVTKVMKEAISKHVLLDDLRVDQETLIVFCDSQSTILLDINLVHHAHTKHFNVRYYFVRDLIDDDKVMLMKIDTKENPIDMLTRKAEVQRRRRFDFDSLQRVSDQQRIQDCARRLRRFYFGEFDERFRLRNMQKISLQDSFQMAIYGAKFMVMKFEGTDYAGNFDDRRSTTEYMFTLGGGPICWESNIQSIMALSTTKVEYMAVAKATKEALWLAGLVKELGVEQGGVQLHYDCQSVIYLAKNQLYHVRPKHVDVRVILDDEYIIVGSANINQRSMDGGRDTEIAMGAYQPNHLSSFQPPRGQIHGFRLSLWCEHLGMIDDAFLHPESMECILKVRKNAEERWLSYFGILLYGDLSGHLLSYPISVENNGKIAMSSGMEFFPDTKARVLGTKSDYLPTILTT
ncbi:phospholipase D alpha 1-like [Phalaenopsis equestris]|uniref:phospholipase D alpha 1-like n=1 Tax=Phalaenopsis equestris TaxID=78828 RepID=UPI0009E2FACF|nr:phospholipase D alpha 1-like [Phalaenopsis equestris]